MFLQRQLLRAAPRATAQLRQSPAGVVRRRLMSSKESAGPPGENAFVRERRLVKEHAEATTDLWRKIFIYGCIPALFLSAGNAYYLWGQHWEHWSHEPPLEERTEYPYQNVRTKNYPWGNGDKTLFWNDSVNYHNPDKTT